MHRDKGALFQWVQSPPGDRSRRKQPGQAWNGSSNITLEREFDAGLAPIELAPQEITRVFLNLFGDGLYAATRWHRVGTGPNFRPALRWRPAI